MSELKKCPCCTDGKGKLWAAYDGTYCVQCDKCGLTTLHKFSKQDVIAAWNRRAQPANEPLTLEQLQEMDGSPVWWWNKSHAPVCTICIVRFGEVSFADFDYSHEDSTGIVQYKRWIKWGFKPYRRKPERSENDG